MSYKRSDWYPSHAEDETQQAPPILPRTLKSFGQILLTTPSPPPKSHFLLIPPPQSAATNSSHPSTPTSSSHPSPNPHTSSSNLSSQSQPPFAQHCASASHYLRCGVASRCSTKQSLKYLAANTCCSRRSCNVPTYSAPSASSQLCLHIPYSALWGSPLRRWGNPSALSLSSCRQCDFLVPTILGLRTRPFWWF